MHACARLWAFLQGSEVCEELMTDGHHHCQWHICLSVCPRLHLSHLVLEACFSLCDLFYSYDVWGWAGGHRRSEMIRATCLLFQPFINQSVSLFFYGPLYLTFSPSLSITLSSTVSIFSRSIAGPYQSCPLLCLSVWSVVSVCTGRSNI